MLFSPRLSKSTLLLRFGKTFQQTFLQCVQLSPEKLSGSARSSDDATLQRRRVCNGIDEKHFPDNIDRHLVY